VLFPIADTNTERAAVMMAVRFLRVSKVKEESTMSNGVLADSDKSTLK
jgi:hypothetical protein